MRIRAMSWHFAMLEEWRHRGLLALTILVAAIFPSIVGIAAIPDPCPVGAAATGPAPDHSVFTQVLKEVVVQGTKEGLKTSLVDYSKLKKDPSKLQKYIMSLCSVDVSKLTNAAKLAFLANAYNAVMISAVLHYEPGITVKEISSHVSGGSVWKEAFATIGGKRMSLDDIEHGNIRSGLSKAMGMSGRIHAMVVCASLSCPDIQTEAFEPETVISQATSAMERWLLNPTKNSGPDGKGNVGLSMIFRWYGSDFVEESGSIQAFVRKYGKWTTSQVPDSAGVMFLDYNWNLNAVNNSGVSTSGSSSSVGVRLAVTVALALASVAGAAGI